MFLRAACRHYLFLRQTYCYLCYVTPYLLLTHLFLCICQSCQITDRSCQLLFSNRQRASPTPELSYPCLPDRLIGRRVG
jgi:hypothetical protein